MYASINGDIFCQFGDNVVFGNVQEDVNLWRIEIVLVVIRKRFQGRRIISRHLLVEMEMDYKIIGIIEYVVFYELIDIDGM